MDTGLFHGFINNPVVTGQSGRVEFGNFPALRAPVCLQENDWFVCPGGKIH
jgi:hypothetical protein